jgi:hypothetical protein
MAIEIAASAAQVQPVIAMTPKQALKFSVAITLFGAAMHYLVSGRKEANLGKMITGALLALASILIL